MHMLKFRRNKSGLLEVINSKQEIEDLKSTYVPNLLEKEIQRVSGLKKEQASSLLSFDGGAVSCGGARSVGELSAPCNPPPRSPMTLDPPVPREFFHWIPAGCKNLFMPGQKLEGIDPVHPELWCALGVAEVRGHRVKLHFDGYSSAYDFWTNFWDPLLKPIGFCERSGRNLNPPRGFDPSLFEWASYLDMVACVAAQSSAFATTPLANVDNLPYPLKVDADLDIQNPFDPNATRLAGKIIDILDERMVLVSATAGSNPMIFWTRLGSPFLGPGPVEGDDNPPNIEVGQKLEVVDPSDASVVRVGVVKQMVRSRVLLGIDKVTNDRSDSKLKGTQSSNQLDDDPSGEEDDCWFPINSPDLYPIGFSAGFNYGKVGLSRSRQEPPSSPTAPSLLPDRLAGPVARRKAAALKSQRRHAAESAAATEQTTTAFTRSVTNHSNSVDDSTNRMFGSRCDSTTTNGPSYSRTNGDAALGRVKCEDQECSSNDSSSILGKRLNGTTSTCDISGKRLRRCDSNDSNTIIFPSLHSQNNFIANNSHNSSPSPQLSDAGGSRTPGLPPHVPLSLFCGNEESPYWQIYLQKHSLPAAPILRSWSVEDVADYILTLPGIRPDHVDAFRSEDIDGEALLLLSDKDMMSMLKLKLGTALKIYTCVSYSRSLYASDLQEDS